MVEAQAQAYVRDRLEAKADGPYFAYLAPETYGWTPPLVDRPRTVRLGRLTIDWDSMRASIGFTMPDVARGEYLIAFCDRSCRRPFGDVDPTGALRVYASSLEARLAQRISRLESGLERDKYVDRQAHRRLASGLRKDIDEVTGELDTASGRIGSLEHAVGALRTGSKPQLPTWALLAGATIAAAAGFGIGRARTERIHHRVLDRELEQLVGPES